MDRFLLMFLPILVVQFCPVLMPITGWVIGTVKDLVVGATRPETR
jgi:hypothetical protein